MHRRILGGATLALCVLSSAPALAATVPVATATELRAALAAAKAGDELVLAPGTYAITSKLGCSANGTPEAPIVVRSATPLAAKIEVDTPEGFAVSGASWHFEGLDIKGVCAVDSACAHAFHVTGAATGFVMRNSRVVDFDAQLKVNASAGGAAIPHGGLVEGCELFDTHARQTSAPVTKLNIDTGDGWVVRANFIHDFHHAGSNATYGAFMKSGGKDGLFERNLVLCTKDDSSPGTTIGLSFGGGGTGAQYCAPAFDKDTPCAVEHDNGTMRNNIIASCSDAGIYINRGKNTRVLHNTVIAPLGVEFRFETSSGEARGNLVSGPIKDRNGGTHVAADNLAGVPQTTFESMYIAPLEGDLRKKGDLSALLGKAAPNTSVVDDYCARARAGMWDLGALQHSLGDCATLLPPLDDGDPDAGTPAGDGGTSGTPGTPGTSGGDGGTDTSTGSSGSAPSGADGAAEAGAGSSDDGCGCRTTPRNDTSAFAPFAGLVALGLALGRRRRAP